MVAGPDVAVAPAYALTYTLERFVLNNWGISALDVLV